MAEDFQSFYQDELRSVLEAFEPKRLNIRKKVRTTAIVVVGIALAAAGVGALSDMPPPGYLIILVIAGILYALCYHLFTKDYRLQFKEEIIGRLVKYLDESLVYYPTGHISESEFMNSQIFKKGIDRYRGEDYVSGTLGKTQFQFSELHAEYRTTTTDSKGRRRTQWHTIFKGLFFIADFNKHFQGHTVVLPDTAEKLFGGWLGKKLQGMNMMRGELIKLEDPEFEKEFAVYGDDQVEARYILSTSLMRRLLDFKRRTGCKTYFSFTDSCVYVAIETHRNLFEARLSQSVLDPALMHEYLADLHLATGIIEELNLNNRIWTKE